MFLSNEALTDIVSKAISALVNSQCPHCESYIETSRYIDIDDIREWVDAEVSSRTTNELDSAADIIHDSLSELGDTFKSLNYELKVLVKLMEFARERKEKTNDNQN